LLLGLEEQQTSAYQAAAQHIGFLVNVSVSRLWSDLVPNLPFESVYAAVTIKYSLVHCITQIDGRWLNGTGDWLCSNRCRK
jgi:hypothetical protein